MTSDDRAAVHLAVREVPDTTPPTVSSIVRVGSNPTNAANIQYTVMFSESVTGVDTTDFSLTTTGVTGASVTGVSGSGATYTVTVGTGSGDGTIRLDLTDDDTIVDVATNALGGAGASNGNYTSGQVFTIDKTAPTVSSSAVQTGSTVDVTFSEAMVSGVTTAANYTVSGTGKGTLANNPNSVALVSGYTYRLTWSSGEMLNGGDITITVANAQDSAGNAVGSPNSATHTSGAIGVLPTITGVTPASGSLRNNASVGYTLSETVASGTITFTRTGGSDDPASPQVYTMVAGDRTSGSHSVSTGKTLVNGAIYTISFDATDAAGNAATQVSSTNVLFDTTAASVTLTTPAGSSRTNNALVSYSLSKTIQSGQIIYTRTGGTADGASPHTYNMSGADLASGSHTAVNTGFTLADGAIYTVSVENVVDLAGNPSSPVSNTAVTFDSTAVAITDTLPAAGGFVKTALVSYTLSEQALSGNVTFTRTGGSQDGEPHVFPLTGGNLSAGAHADVDTGQTLVDGAIYTVSFDATDMAANPATTVSNASVTFDTSAPTLSPVQIASNNADPSVAVVGNTITLSFVSSENLTSPTVTIAGNAATVSGGPTSWSAAYTVLTGDALGVVPFSISFGDLAGNPGTPVTATSDSSSVTKIKANSNVTVWPTASTITYGQTLAASLLTGGTATPDGTFAFTIPGAMPDAGTASQGVTFTPSDTANYNTSSGTVNVTVNQSGQAITVTTPAPSTAAYNSQFTVAATAPGGTVTYSSGSPGVCTSINATFTMIASSGTCVVQYDQTGSANFLPATQVTANVTAEMASQTIGTISFTPPTLVVGGTTTVSASASSGLTVSFSSNTPTICTVTSGTTVNGISTGSCIIAANQAGDGNYNPAIEVTQPIEVTSASSTVTVSLAGTGSGTVNSSSSPDSIDQIACSGDCTATYSSGTVVTLMATPGASSVFSGWSGGGCSGIGNCVFTPSADTTVTATFDPSPLVKLPGDVYYPNIQAAYNAAVAGSVMKVRDQVFAESLLFNGVDVVFDGGYNDAWVLVEGNYTTILGDVTVAAGAVTISNVVIQNP